MRGGVDNSLGIDTNTTATAPGSKSGFAYNSQMAELELLRPDYNKRPKRVSDDVDITKSISRKK